MIGTLAVDGSAVTFGAARRGLGGAAVFSLPISTFSALGVSHVMRSINVRYLLTYLLSANFQIIPARGSVRVGSRLGSGPHVVGRLGS